MLLGVVFASEDRVLITQLVTESPLNGSGMNRALLWFWCALLLAKLSAP